MMGAVAQDEAPPTTVVGAPPAAQPMAAPAPQPVEPPAADAEEPVQDIVVTGEKGAPPGDPLEQLNAKSFEAVQSVDKAVVEPVAKAYNKGLSVIK